MNRYFLGIDIGGTKSHALIANQNGRAVGFGEGGPGNYEVVGWDGLRATLQAITAQTLTSAGIGKEQIAGAGLGIAGYDWPAEREPTRQAIESLDLEAPFEFVNDTIIGLIAGATEGWGVAVVAGTSNNCRGRDRQGREGRVTGCSSWFGEYGGAHELVTKAVRAVSMAWTQRGPATSLTEAFIELTGTTDAMDLLEGLALEHYDLSAADAPVILRVAAEGDAVAQEAIRWAGRELGSLVIGVTHQLGFERIDFEVVLIGSMFRASPMLVDAMEATVHRVAPGARLVHLTVPPVVGGVLLGMEQAGLEATALRQSLIKSTRELIVP